MYRRASRIDLETVSKLPGINKSVEELEKYIKKTPIWLTIVFFILFVTDLLIRILVEFNAFKIWFIWI